MRWIIWRRVRLALITTILIGLLLLTILALLAGQLRQEARIRKVEGLIIGFLLELVSVQQQSGNPFGIEIRRFGCATAILATYWSPTSELTLCNAGHPAPLWWSARRGRSITRPR
jgi:uncharacterized membrane protein (UPF0136 family)